MTGKASLARLPAHLGSWLLFIHRFVSFFSVFFMVIHSTFHSAYFELYNPIYVVSIAIAIENFLSESNSAISDNPHCP